MAALIGTSKNSPMKKIIAVTLSCFALTACIHVIKPDVEQGNIVTQASLNSLKPGMTQTQVTKLLGTPVLDNTFSDDRLDYVYTLQKGHAEMVEQRITCYFKNKKLQKVVGNIHPGIEKQS